MSVAGRSLFIVFFFFFLFNEVFGGYVAHVHGPSEDIPRRCSSWAYGFWGPGRLRSIKDIGGKIDRFS